MSSNSLISPNILKEDLRMSEINEIGKRFDRALSVLQVSNKEISELFDTSSQNVSNLKKADRLNDLMSRIAIKYDINLNWLMSGIGDMFIQKDTFTQYGVGNQQIGTQNNPDSSNINNFGSPKTQNIDEDILKLVEALSSVANALNKKQELKQELTKLISTLPTL